MLIFRILVILYLYIDNYKNKLKMMKVAKILLTILCLTIISCSNNDMINTDSNEILKSKILKFENYLHSDQLNLRTKSSNDSIVFDENYIKIQKTVMTTKAL